ncbi:MAG: sigma-70 family RNA polymerase sigma factor [Bacteroidota bacterium]|nr:sigma-70 family RNA polymerase sigma factor [Bacteroidota bacterium]MDP4249096.1 sigma-70 family RNA polymerase sigma factor [Bacteroidota bacterium]
MQVFLNLTPSYSEHELIAALKDRDNEAFQYLYDHYSGSLYSIILQIVQDTTLANDVLQDVFVNVWRRIETYDPTKGRLFTWLLNISRNASIDLLRSKDYVNSRKNRELTDSVYGIDQVTQTGTDSIGLSKFLAKLRPDHRVLIELAYFKGYTHEEIAHIEDIPLGTVKTRIRTALLQLREYLK